jgi:hypothetical protein
MNSNTARAAVGGLVVIVAIVLPIVLSGDSNSGDTTKGVTTIVIKHGKLAVNL